MTTNHHIPTRVLIIDDEPDVAQILGRIIRAAGNYHVDLVTEACDIRARLAKIRPELVFLDLVMPAMDGFDLIEIIQGFAPGLPVVVVSAHSSLPNAVRAVRLGAFDFLAKPFDPEAIELILAKVGREFDLQARLGDSWEEDPWLRPLRGLSHHMAALRQWILKVRPVRTSVLVQGESGTGKELVARAIHADRGPFVALNMAAIPAELAESELFGHRQGAFTGATQERPGLLAEANGGTLFLDEVNAMSASLQAKLLRVLQERRVRPVGSNREVAVDFRLISASNEDVEAAVQRGQFRRDLYHRLRVLSITLPPLRERISDVPVLIEEFVQHYARAHGRRVRRLAGGVAEELTRRDWPGNIRELENLIEEAVILSPDDAVELHLPRAVAPEGGQALPLLSGEPVPLAVMERSYVAEVLRYTGGNKARAARLLDIDYKTLLRKLTGTQ